MKFTLGLYGSITPTYDKIGKLTQKVTELRTGSSASTIKLYKTETYRYLQTHYVETYVSEYVSQMGTSASDAAPDTTIYRYTYDKNGNITAISDGSDVVQNQYEYDHLGQLIREDNRALGYTYVYTYDDAGNRTSKKTYAFTLDTLGTVIDEITYHYSNDGWGDLLTDYGRFVEDYDEFGDPIMVYREDAIFTYDKIGNPLSVAADDGSGLYVGYVMKWDGRQLVEMCPAEGGASDLWPYGDTIYFTYNADGIRTHVQQLDWDTYYTVNGGMILEEQKQYCGSPYYTMLYIYDENGAPIGLKYDTKYYYFEKNLQGDIVGIYNEAGVKIGGYIYDAWGNFTVSVTSGVTSTESNVVWNNPFRYRGYYYDTYTGWYYLQTRYYDPEIGRFISGDKVDVILVTPMGLTDKNLYAYCDNNPITRVDADGEFWNVIAGAVVGAVINLVSSVVAEVIEGNFEPKDLAQIAISTTIGGIEGAAIAACPTATVAISAVSSVVDTALNGWIDGNSMSEIVVDSTISGTLSAVTGTWGNDFVKGNKLLNNAHDSIKNAFGKGINPKVRKAAKKTIKNAFNYIGKSYLGAQMEDLACGGIGAFTSWYVKSSINRIG